jgi:hypothetical protein
MLRWPAFLLLVVLLQLLEVRFVHARFVPDLAIGMVVFCGLCARVASVPALLALVALVRAPLCGSTPSAEFLLLGTAVLVLLPLRRWFFQGSLLYLAVLSVAVALLLLGAYRLRLPAGTAMLLAERPWLPALSSAAVLGPVLVLLLRALPPSRWFVAEDSA